MSAIVDALPFGWFHIVLFVLVGGFIYLLFVDSQTAFRLVSGLVKVIYLILSWTVIGIAKVFEKLISLVTGRR